LQLQLLFERELGERALLPNRKKLPRMAQATATVSEMARISRALIDRSLNIGIFPIPLVGKRSKYFRNKLTIGTFTKYQMTR
jgi:hypothetical protein